MNHSFLSVAAVLGLVATSLAYAGGKGIDSGHWSWSCGEKEGMNSYQISYRGKKITSLKVGEYKVIENGVHRNDQDIGANVFDVKVKGMRPAGKGALKLQISLKDYSDFQSWDLYLQSDYDGHSLVKLSSYQSSDGDGLVHRHGDTLECEVKREE